MIKSKALEVNLASYHVDVTINEKYLILQEIMSKYYGLMEGFNIFLKELSHPYRNWDFIVAEARGYSLEYYHLIATHPKGPDAARLIIEIFTSAIESSKGLGVKTEAVDNLLLFILKIIKNSGKNLNRFSPELNRAFDYILECEDEHFYLFVKSYYQTIKIAETFLLKTSDIKTNFRSINLLLLKNLQYTYDYWLKKKDPQIWFEEALELEYDHKREKELEKHFNKISHSRIQELNSRLDSIKDSEDLDSGDILKNLMEFPAYGQIVEMYRKIPQELLHAGKESAQGNQWKVIFLFQVMNIPGLSMIHEEILRDVNRTLSWLIENETFGYIRKLIQKTFSILKRQIKSFPETALNCVLNMGKGVYKTDESDLINVFIDDVIDLGFQTPMIDGVDNEWQIRVNSAHIQNIRVWLKLIELNPKWSTKLLSDMIIHISLCGVFIKDTDLFPRDITRFLNSDIGPVYNLAKQLARLFPAYFNDIGAEGKLRDISTRVDEITYRKDTLIHFLRKQSHVESSSQIIGFMEAVIRFWQTCDKEYIKSFVPVNIYDQIEDKGRYVDGVHRAMSHLKKQGYSGPDHFLDIKEQELIRILEKASNISNDDKERVTLLIKLYKLLHQKYNVDFVEIDTTIAQLSLEAFPEINRLKIALAEPDLKKKIFILLKYLNQLKKLIHSSEKFEIREDIYKKRHITIDIPSMYGSYHEMKFDALGLTFRIESLVNTLFEEIVENIDLSLITKATFYQIYSRIRLFDKALKLDGISSMEIERQLELLAHSLEVKGFTYTQYLDIFKGFSKAVRDLMNDYFNNIHEQNLTRILSILPKKSILGKYLPQFEDGITDSEKIKHRISEVFFRDRIALSLGLQQFDLFISRILRTLFQQSDKLPKDKLHQLLIYDPENAMTSIYKPNNRVFDLINLGNKGLNLIKLNDFGLPIPPGFIVTTEVFRCRDMIDSYSPAEKNLREQLAHHILKLEKTTGKSFGDPESTLLFSVRSGSSISQPGMMDTFLNVGINEEIAFGIARGTGNKWFAWDNYRRFLQCYGMACNLKRDDFDAIIRERKQKAGILYKREFSGEQMRSVAMLYKKLILESGISIPDDPFDQLYMTIKKVFDSWESSKARAYRKIMGISDDWGTAVTVQAMVYGNLSEQSGTGVFFTHNPKWPGEPLRLWGDFSRGNQGEDVVSGLVNTLPISISQQEIEMRETDMTLQTHFPEIYNALKDWASDLIYEKGWSPQEMEFTFENPLSDQLYILQTRDMAIRERKKVLAFEFSGHETQNYLGHGIGVSGGAMSGRVVFSLEDIDKWRKLEPDTLLILARGDTVPDDIREIYAADGLLTARGGVTSHASVVAHRLGKTCVVGCHDLICDESSKNCRINNSVIMVGDYISIDGLEGSVYEGLMKISEA